MKELGQAFTMTERRSYHPVSRAHPLKRDHLLPDMKPALDSRFAGGVEGGDAGSIRYIQSRKPCARASP